MIALLQIFFPRNLWPELLMHLVVKPSCLQIYVNFEQATLSMAISSFLLRRNFSSGKLRISVLIMVKFIWILLMSIIVFIAVLSFFKLFLYPFLFI